ncbi:S8 family serine peptidase [Pseudooceanicola sp. HF7]|uniref:S8 family serine peptidase n=1 Tax=Pseudooceanicola sp. HF7 TaxID=2721560 RepID=UPI0020CA9C3F|nr:S8 family serine peptidase [Pseudooceanicola sp. HF7]
MKHRSAYRALFPLCLAALALGGCAGDSLQVPPPAQVAADAAEVVDPREIVALVPDRAAAARLLSGARAEGFTLREQTALAGLGLEMLRLEIPGALGGPGAIAALERIEPLAVAGVNHAYRPAASHALEYADALIGWPAVPCRALGPIGMIDTGVDAGLPELSAAVIHSAGFARGAPAGRLHGSEVASLLADPRRLSGVTLYAASVVGMSARGEQEAGVDSLLEALSWLAGQGVRLVNISLAGPYNKLLDRGIDRAEAHGMTIVAAVGNDGAGAPPRYPAALENVIGVTAVDADRAIYRDAVQGRQVDVAAPGVDVLLKLDGRMVFATGTSIAAPFVTARIASDPGLYDAPAARVRAGLRGLSDDLGAPGPDPVFGAGLVKAPPRCAAP